MNNAKKFKQIFGIYATELWAMPEEKFLEWLNAEVPEQDRWIPFKRRKATEDDGTSFDYIMEGSLPEDGQTILITIKPDGHEPVQVDTYYGGGGEECALDSGYSLCDEAIAWRPLPEPYQEDKA